MVLLLAETDDHIRRAFPALKELRPHLPNPETLVAQVRRQQAAGYRLMLAEDQGGAIVAAAGCRVLETLAWGRFLYVDDLVTLPAHRGRGHGSALMAWLLEEALRQGCSEIHLDSGVQRFDAHALYHRHGLRITSHHFSAGIGNSSH